MKGLSVRVCWCGGLSIRGANEDLSVRCKEHERERGEVTRGGAVCMSIGRRETIRWERGDEVAR